MYPNGLNAEATEDELNISFRPSPQYAKMAEAAAPEGTIKGVQVRTVAELEDALREAERRVGEERLGMLIEVLC